MDFTKSLYENLQDKRTPFFVAHRGSCGANIPYNTLLAYKLAVDQGADVIEIDVSKSKDGVFFVFHPGMEKVYLNSKFNISEMTAAEVSQIPILNVDGVETHYRIPTLEKVLSFLKQKTYINVDKFWTDIQGITEMICQCGVQKQVIVKTPTEEKYLHEVEKFASDLMFMPLVRKQDMLTEKIERRNINFIGVETLFESLDDQVASKEYIKSMHDKGYLVWANSIVYDEKDIISAGLTDDISLEKGGDYGWGMLADLGYDFIQTDWLTEIKNYFSKRQR